MDRQEDGVEETGLESAGSCCGRAGVLFRAPETGMETKRQIEDRQEENSHVTSTEWCPEF